MKTATRRTQAACSLMLLPLLFPRWTTLGATLDLTQTPESVCPEAAPTTSASVATTGTMSLFPVINAIDSAL